MTSEPPDEIDDEPELTLGEKLALVEEEEAYREEAELLRQWLERNPNQSESVRIGEGYR